LGLWNYMLERGWEKGGRNESLFISQFKLYNRKQNNKHKGTMNTQKEKPENQAEKLTFTEREYGSRDGMLTTVWGPGLWHFLHTMSFNYPIAPTEKDKKHYRQFILQLRYVLPCGKCRENLVKNFKRLPLRAKDLESRESFSRYVYELHEVVNTMLHKNSGLTYEEVRERYEHFRARCASAKKRNTQTAKKVGKLEKRSNSGGKTLKKGRGKRGKKELGCTEPLYEGEKAKCVLKIVPLKEKCDTMQIDSQCFKKPMDS